MFYSATFAAKYYSLNKTSLSVDVARKRFYNLWKKQILRQQRLIEIKTMSYPTELFKEVYFRKYNNSQKGCFQCIVTDPAEKYWKKTIYKMRVDKKSPSWECKKCNLVLQHKVLEEKEEKVRKAFSDLSINTNCFRDIIINEEVPLQKLRKSTKKKNVNERKSLSVIDKKRKKKNLITKEKIQKKKNVNQEKENIQPTAEINNEVKKKKRLSFQKRFSPLWKKCLL